MLRLSGEIAGGVILWLCNPNYIRDVVVPAVAEGREKAGKPVDGFDIVAAVPCAVVEDPAEAHATMRRDLIPYFGLPFYRKMLDRSGFGAEIEAFDKGAAAGDVDAMQAAISTEFIDSLCAIGDEDAVRAGIQRYRDAGCGSPAVSAGRQDRLRPGAEGGGGHLKREGAARGGPFGKYGCRARLLQLAVASGLLELGLAASRPPRARRPP